MISSTIVKLILLSLVALVILHEARSANAQPQQQIVVSAGGDVVDVVGPAPKIKYDSEDDKEDSSHGLQQLCCDWRHYDEDNNNDGGDDDDDDRALLYSCHLINAPASMLRDDFGFDNKTWSFDDYTLALQDNPNGDELVLTLSEYTKGRSIGSTADRGDVLEQILAKYKRKLRNYYRKQNIRHEGSSSISGTNNTNAKMMQPPQWNKKSLTKHDFRAWEMSLVVLSIDMVLRRKILEEQQQEYEEVQEAEVGEICMPTVPVQQLSTSILHYDVLDFEIDDLQYKWDTCKSDYFFGPDHSMWNFVHEETSHYQTIKYDYLPSMDDMCFSLDRILQICSCYRPHYHENVVHMSARFISDVKRVVFIGGGDSMLLHEILKYPNLELVAGLELDQAVTRNAFKYFHVSPHFDDPRVEWWYGDATKSLLLLPEDYWASFDLVLVDLSETVMSLTVTSELDVFDALQLLLKPEGIMVKNELYFEKMSKVFDYTVQVAFVSPVICDQVLVMGSNSVDFMHHAPKDHSVPNLYYESLHEEENRYDYVHDFRTNDASAQGKCDELPKPASRDQQERSAGVLEIVEAEQISISLEESIADKLMEAIKLEGFTLIEKSESVVTVVDDVTLLRLHEGYVLARKWPKLKYVAFDINLWGKSYKLKSLSKALTDAVGSNLVSSYRIVVGGMYESSTWREDQMILGPQIRQTRNCRDKTSPLDLVTSSEVLVEAMLEKAISGFVHKETINALVVCGASEASCQAKQIVAQHQDITNGGFYSLQMTKLSSCASSLAGEVSTKVAQMFSCERDLIVSLSNAISSFSEINKFDLVVFDASVEYEMLQIWNSVMSEGFYLESFFKDNNVIMAWSTNPDEERWRQNFLDRYRKQVDDYPVSRGEFSLRAKDVQLVFGVVSTADEKFPYSLKSVESRVREAFTSMNQQVQVQLINIQGGNFPFIDPFEPHMFRKSDYDYTLEIEQYLQQEPIGHQVILQLVPNEDRTMTSVLTLDVLKASLLASLNQISFFDDDSMPQNRQIDVTSIASGGVVSYIGRSGHAILVWDGKGHIDINYYSAVELPRRLKVFEVSFMLATSYGFTVALRNDMPRGVGRVINFKSELNRPTGSLGNSPLIME